MRCRSRWNLFVYQTYIYIYITKDDFMENSGKPGGIAVYIKIENIASTGPIYCAKNDNVPTT